MSNVNGNDIDDLFKRAADGYPLRTNSSDWDRVAADLDKDLSLILPPVSVETDKRRSRRFFWLLLLLPLGGLGYLTFRNGHPGGSVQKPGTLTAKQSRIAGAIAGTDSGEKAASHGLTGAAIAGKKGNEDLADHSGSAGKKAAGEKTGANPEGGPDAAGQVRTATAGTGGTDAAGIRRTHAAGTRVTDEAGTKGNDAVGPRGSDAAAIRRTDVAGTKGNDAVGMRRTDAAGKKGNDARHGRTRDAAVETGVTDARGKAVHERAGKRRIDVTGKDRVDAAGKGVADASGERAGETDPGGDKTNTGRSTYIVAKDPLPSKLSLKPAVWERDHTVNIPVKANREADPMAVVKPGRTPVTLKKKKPSFYVGLTAAPDLSTIKFQSIKGTGTTFGLILGYNFGSRWGIETGVSLDRKKYYTAGEYYNKKNYTYLNMIDNLKIDGVCHMWEVPVNVRYNLGAGQKMKWFATAGLSNYFMTREQYDYRGTHYGNPWSWISPDKKNGSQYWFSIVNLSIGYEQRLGKVGNLRLEPYLRIPLAGVGSGSLPIMSAGLNIGITRRIW